MLRARLEGLKGYVRGWSLDSCVNINRTRAAAAREGCREMDVTRKNRRPGVRVRDGVYYRPWRDLAVVWCWRWRCGVCYEVVVWDWLVLQRARSSQAPQARASGSVLDVASVAPVVTLFGTRKLVRGLCFVPARQRRGWE